MVSTGKGNQMALGKNSQGRGAWGVQGARGVYIRLRRQTKNFSNSTMLKKEELCQTPKMWICHGNPEPTN